jgi:flagellar basal-body rod protein FlgG
VDSGFYAACAGLRAQSQALEVSAHNLANVNTIGFKKSRVEFEDLVYQQIKAAGSASSATGEAPIGLETGVGTRPVATARDFASGNLRATNNPMDVAIEGRGFLQVTTPEGEVAYTRSGALHLSAEGKLVTADGYPLEPAITIPANATTVSISRDGIVSAAIQGQAAPQQIGTIELAMFQNPAGLLAKGGNLFALTSASGEPQTALPGVDGLGTLAQGFLEESNVSVVEEMVNMILGQRAYEANAKVVKAADEMLSQVNNLSR